MEGMKKTMVTLITDVTSTNVGNISRRRTPRSSVNTPPLIITMSPIFSVFYGPIINPAPLTDYAIFPRALLAVDSCGNIAWMEQDSIRAV